jgi:hypothetical protein
MPGTRRKAVHQCSPPMEGILALLGPDSARLPYPTAKARRVLLRRRDRLAHVVKVGDSFERMGRACLKASTSRLRR